MRSLGPRQDNNFSIMISVQILEMFNQMTTVFCLIILLLASAGLLVGGVDLIEIMLISVAERTREIGMSKAAATGHREVLRQLVVEASALTACDGGRPLVCSWGGSWQTSWST